MPFKDPEKAREHYRLRYQRRRAENLEKVREQSRKSMRRFRAANPERAREIGKKASANFRARHPETVLETNRAWYCGNLEVARAGANRRYKKWRQISPEKAASAYRRWREKNPEKRREFGRNYRGRKRSASGECSAQKALARIAMFGDKCAYCPAPYEHLDHAIALARGGTNWPANLRPACRKCNSRKGARDWRKWKVRF